MRYLFFTLFMCFLFTSSSYAVVLDNFIEHVSINSAENVMGNERYNRSASLFAYYADRRPAPPPPHRHDVDRRPAPPAPSYNIQVRPAPPPPHRHDVDRRPAPSAPSYNIQVRPAPPPPKR